jgi:predicted dehydrogenase
MQPVKWGILGTGAIARTFTEDVLLLDDQAVVAVGSRTPEKAREFAGRYGIERAYGSYEELAADEGVDVVYVATPHSGHFAAAGLCLEAGRSVLVEKPFTVTAAEAAELVELAASRRLFAMEGMWTRCNPLVRELKENVTAGMIGEVVAVQADFAFAAAYDPKSRLWNPELAGGALLDLGVYPIAFGSMLLGAPDAVHALATPGPTGVDSNTAVIAHYAGGAVGLYHCGLLADSPGIATVTGTRGRVVIERFHRPERMTYEVAGEDPRETTISLHGHGFTYEAAEVARCLRKGLTESPLMPLAETLTIMQTLDSARVGFGARAS